MTSTCLKRPALRYLSVFFLLLLCVPNVWAGSSTVVISQVYGGGGSASALYNADYVELFNLSATSQSLNGLAVQYWSSTSTGTASLVITLPNVSLAPGQHFLIEGPSGACASACVTLPTPDLTSSLAASGSAGRIYLTSTTTALSGTCPTANIVDFVGYGSGVICSEGSHPAPATTITLVDVRTNECTDTDDNAADFTAVATTAVSPRTSSSAATPCVATAGISVSGAANPSSVYQGTSTTLTGTVTPGVGSTGVTVTADLSAFGGSSTTPLLDNGVAPDATAGDNIYSVTLNVGSNAPLGPNTVKITASDAETHTATSNVSVSVLAPIALVPIHTVQGNVPGTATYLGQTVMVSGIVTGITSNGFYIQAKDSDADSDPATPEGIFIHTGTGSVPAEAVLKNNIQVTGVVGLYPPQPPTSPIPSTATLPGTEIDTPGAYTVLSTGNPLPTPITLTTTNPSPSGGFAQLQRYQSMRVTVPSFTVTGPTDGTLTETAETYVSNGQFWGTVTGDARPVREPGLEVLDLSTASRSSTIPRFDDNPEVFLVDSMAMLPTPGPLDLATGTMLTGMTGVMDFSDGDPLFIIDTPAASARPVNAGGGVTVTAATPAMPGELTIGDQNLERFYDVAKETTGAIAVTQAAYTLRLAKASLEIRNLMHSPDIMAVEEVENIQTLNTLAAQISTDAIAASQPDPQYVGYLDVGNDTSGINVGFLVNPNKITVTDVTQIGKSSTENGTTTLLNDRPPLVLRAGVKRPGMPDYPITIIVNHLRSLTGITDDTSSDSNARNKREQQAEALAMLVQTHQSAGEHVVVVGDLNAFEFNDGLVDSMDIVRGIEPTNVDVLAGPSSPLVTPALVDAAPTNVANGVYTYDFNGNAQSIDHFFVTADIASITRTSPVHVNADFPVIYRNDATRPEGGSDHDGVVGYIKIPGTTVLSFTPASLTFTGTQTLNTMATLPVTITNTGTTAVSITSVVTSAGFSVSANTCGASLAGPGSCTVTVGFTPTVAGPASGTLTLTDSDVTGTQTINLSGTGSGVFSTTTLTASTASSLLGGSITLTATVTGSTGPTPTGTVNFFDGTTLLNSGGTALNGLGVATFSTTALAVGNHSLTAVYAGAGTYPTSTSNAVTISVAAPDFTFSVSNGQMLLNEVTKSASTTVSVALVNGFSQPVSFACSGLPANSHCTFSPAMLTASGTSTLTVFIDGASGALRSPFGNMGETGGVMALLALPFLLRRKARTTLRRAATLMALMMMAVGFAAISGCGGNSPSTPPGTSTVTVTASSGSVSHSATFTLNVQ